MKALVYAGVAVFIAAGGVVWVARWAAYRRGRSARPADLSPVGADTLGFTACALAGAVGAALLGSRTESWATILFMGLAIGLAARCAKFLAPRDSRAVDAAILVLATAAGAAIAIA